MNSKQLRQQPDIQIRRERIANGMATLKGNCRATVLCIPRHGYATTRTTIENLYANTAEPFVLLYVDIASPAVVRE